MIDERSGDDLCWSELLQSFADDGLAPELECILFGADVHDVLQAGKVKSCHCGPDELIITTCPGVSEAC